MENIVNSSVNIPSTLGVHTFNVRVRDAENTWGPLFSTVVDVKAALATQRSIEVSAGEYFWDTDPGQGNGTPYVAFDGNFNETLETLTNNNVSVPSTTGVHVLHTRARDAENNWGQPFRVIVNVLPNIVTTRNTYVQSAEYYFDTDPGQGNGTPIFAQDGNFNAVLEAISGGAIPNPVTAGVHALYIRAQDAENNWGPTFGVVVNIDTTIHTFTTSFTGDSIVCVRMSGTSDTYTYSAVAHGSTTFNWTATSGTILSGQGTPTATIQWSNSPQPASLKVVETSPNFVDSAELNITVNLAPVISINASNMLVCPGDSITLTAVGANNTYTWNNGVSNGVSFVPSLNVSYIVTATNANSCFTIDSIMISTHHVPSVSINASNTTICAGEAVTLTGVGADTYIWDNGVTDGVSFVPTATTTYQVIGTDAGSSCTDTTTVTVVVNPLPSAAITQLNGTYCDTTPSVTLIGIPTGGVFSGTNVSGTTFTPVGLAAGNYTISYMYTDNNGCSDSTSAQVTIQVCVTGINALAASSVKVYPVPTEQLVWVEWSSLPTKNIQLRMLSVDGKVLLEREVLEPKINLDLSDFPGGMYFIQTIQETEIKTFKVIKE